MNSENIAALHKLINTEEREVFKKIVVDSGNKYVEKVFQIDPKLSEQVFSMKDLFVFYVQFCENVVNIPHNVINEFKGAPLNDMDSKDINEYVENIVERVVNDATKYVNK